MAAIVSSNEIDSVELQLLGEAITAFEKIDQCFGSWPVKDLVREKLFHFYIYSLLLRDTYEITFLLTNTRKQRNERDDI
jgi:hypothetical protein